MKSVNDGLVLLAGKANTLLDHLLALQDAYDVIGVGGVASEVQAPTEIVQQEVVMVYGAPDSGAALEDKTDDLRITAAVKLQLLADPSTPATQINVDTSHGVVTLFGTVDSVAAKEAAAGDVRRVQGVSAVDNLLQLAAVPTTATASDDAIKAGIEKALSQHEEYKHVSVKVANGVVALSGSVPSGWDRVHVAMLSRGTAGARAVQTQVQVVK